jgi:membrane protease subunit (stomatin/prohibitin family)
MICGYIIFFNYTQSEEHITKGSRLHIHNQYYDILVNNLIIIVHSQNHNNAYKTIIQVVTCLYDIPCLKITTKKMKRFKELELLINE